MTTNATASEGVNFISLRSPKQESCGFFECAHDERLLYAGLRAGMALPHECATGTCGSCKAKVVRGEVVTAWPEAPGMKFVKPANGEILLCQSYARSDCDVLVRSAPQIDVDAAILPEYFRGRVRRSGMLRHDVLIMEVTLDRPMRFVAGQFALFAADGVEGFRGYSMVNRGGTADTLELIVKRKPGGGLTEFLFGQDRAGLEINVFGPLGHATFSSAEQPSGDLVLAAGGTGIAGLMSVLAEASASGFLERRRAVVHFGVRTLSDLFFLDRFTALCRMHPDSLRAVIAISEEDVPPAHVAAYPQLRFHRGMLHEVLGACDFSEFVNVTAYAAGPVPAVEAVTSVLLLKHRVSASRIRFDRFG